jgi:KDO2-lipid IV(A) lauroyltransferase
MYYYLLLALLYPISLLPFWVLYRISDLAFFILYHLLGYRKQIVWDNLRHAFPEKTDAELLFIRRKFYKSFCDQWIETIKLLTVPYKELNKRFTANWEVVKQLGLEGKNTYLIAGHTFNWEWANVVFPLNVPQQYACVYLPVSNKGFDKLMSRIRSRSGAWMVSMKALKSGLSRLNTKQHILTLAADQNPEAGVIGAAEWISFLNREVPVFKGPEQLSRRGKAAVVFCAIRKEKRGHYNMTLSHYCDDASQTQAGEILRAYIRFLEEQIRQQPENWLWSHRRWKHVRKV